MAYADRIITLVGANTLDDVATEWLAKGFPANPGSVREEDRLGGYANTPPLVNSDTGDTYVVVRVPKEWGLLLTMATFTTCRVEDTFPQFTVNTPEGDYVVNMPGITGGDWSPAELPSETAAALAKAEIDYAAAAVHVKYTTTAGNMALVYATKQVEITEWEAAGKPSLDIKEPLAPTVYVYPGLKAELDAMRVKTPGITDQAAVDNIKTQIIQWKGIFGPCESFRRVGKETVGTNATSTEIATTMTAAKSQLAGI